jgi:hypothetical protein
VEVRQTLKETLEWPTKYAHLYKDVPIRMRSGYALHPHLTAALCRQIISEPIIFGKLGEG